MEKMKGGHALVRALKAHGVQQIFGIPGSHILSIYDGLLAYPGIVSVVTRHEQGAAFAADAYARVSRKPGVAVVTAGPGLLNAMTGMLEAYNSSTPVLLICGEIPSGYLGREWGALHELKNQTGILESVTKWRKCIMSAGEIPEAVSEAFHYLSAGYPKPVALSIPHDVLEAEADVEVRGEPREMERIEADPSVIVHVVDALAQSAAPVILAGWGAAWSDAGDEIRQLSEYLGCPIITTERGRGVVADTHPNVLGNLMQGGLLLDVLQKADLVVALGTRFDQESTFDWKLKMPPLIHVDINPTQIGKIYPAKVGIAKDARTVLRQILVEVKKRKIVPAAPPFQRFKEVLKSLTQCHLDAKGRQYIQAISAALPENAIVTCDTALISSWAGRYLPARNPRSFLRPDGSSTMGFALPAAIGARLASPERPVLALCGDAGFMFTASELGTVIQHGISIIVVIFNDSGYGWIRFMQDLYYGRRAEADLVNPDFMEFAHSFGIKAVRTDSPEGLQSVLSSTLKLNAPAVIEVVDEVGAPY